MLTEPFIPRVMLNEPQMQELNLRKHGLDDLSCCRLVDALKMNTWIQTVDLAENKLTDDSALFLAEMLLAHPSITALDISNNPMTSKGGKAFVQALQTNYLMQQLTCEGDMFDDTILEKITYWLTFNRYPQDLKKYLPAIQENHPEVFVLDLSAPHRDAKAYDVAAAKMVANAIAQNTHVRRLVLDNNFKTDQRILPIIAALENNSTLTSLSLASDHVGPDGAQALSQILLHNTTLTEINLADNEIGDAGGRALLHALETNNYCRSLVLRDNAVSDDYLVKIDGILTLNSQPNELKSIMPLVITNDPWTRELNLCGASVPGSTKRPEDLKAYYTNLSVILLAEALQRNAYVTTIRLRDNLIGPEGAKALADLLRVNKMITELDLRDNFITDDGVRSLVMGMEVNGTLLVLELSGNPVSPKMTSEVEHFLFLNRMPNQMREALAPLKTNSPDVVDLNFSQLSQNPPPSSSHKMDVLDDRCVLLLCQTLPSNTHLRSLNLSFQAITDVAVDKLASVLHVNRSVTSLSLFHNSAVTDVGIQALLKAIAVNDSLKAVDCGSTGASEAILEELKAAIELNCLSLKLKHLVPLLRRNAPSVRKVSFAPERNDGGLHSRQLKGDMNDRGCQILTAALQDNICVTSLDFTNNQITSYGVYELARWLAKNQVVVSLTLTSNYVTADGARFLSTHLKGNTVLRELILSDNPLSEEGGGHLLRLMKDNDTIQQLATDRCGTSELLSRSIRSFVLLNLYPKEVKRTMVQVQTDDTEMDTVDWSCATGGAAFTSKRGISNRPQVDDECIEMAVHLLSTNQTVTYLDLSNAAISTRGCQALATLLKKSKVLRIVRIANTPVTDEALAAICDVLPINSSLHTFDISGCEAVSELTAQRLKALVALNTQPRALKPLLLRLEARTTSPDEKPPRYMRLCEHDGERYYDDTTCEVLRYFLSQNDHSIELIDLSNNMITDAGVLHLVPIIQNSLTLWSLKLNRNHITDEGACTLLRALSGPNVNLQTLELDGNDIANVATLQQIEQKLNAIKKRVQAAPKAPSRRKGSPVLSTAASLNEMKNLDDMILREALADCKTFFMYSR